MKKLVIAFVLITPFIFVACDKDEEDQPAATPYTLVIPQGLPPMNIPSTNPLTVEGVALGKRLFYDPILSGNNTQSCASCHLQEYGFTDPNQFSTGIDGIQGPRNAMPLINLGWQTKFFWGPRDWRRPDQLFFAQPGDGYCIGCRQCVAHCPR